MPDGDIGSYGVVTKIMLGIVSVVIAANLGFMGFASNVLVKHGEELAEMRGDQFGSKDGLEAYKSMNDMRISFERALNLLSERVAKMPTESPPQWFRATVDRLEVKVEGLERSQEALRLQIAKLTAVMERQQ